jgi:segregation and condensation protein B
MDIAEIEAITESVLFAYGQPISIAKLASVLELERQAVEGLLDGMMEAYNDRRGGLRIVRLGDYVQLCTRPEFAYYIRRCLEGRKAPPLSPASLEVLAIIAYRQPVTKAYIEQVRGVECSRIIYNLEEKGLIEVRGKLDAPGHPRLYGTTAHFLRCFGLSNLDELPTLPELSGGERHEVAQ